MNNPSARDPRYRVATIISRISDPYLVYGLLAAVSVVRSIGLGAGQKLLLLFALLGMVAVPFVLLSVAVSKKYVSNWYITDRRQRPLALGILIVLTLINLLIVRFFGDPFITSMFTLFLIWVVGFFAITLDFKISGHTGSLTLTAVMIAAWYGWPGYVLLFLVLPVAWSRVVRGDHRLVEVIAGFFYSLAVVFVTSRMLPIF